MLFIGNQKTVRLLERSLEKGKIAQAYIFAGPEAVGKFTLSKAFALALIKNEKIAPPGFIGEGDKAEKKATTIDLMILEPEKEEKKGVIKIKEIKVENAREAQKFLLTFPINSKYKTLIVNDAHRLTEEAQNSFLKILEEPNSTSVIILVTHQLKKILPTLRSRSQIVNFSLVGEQEIREWLKENGFISTTKAIALSLGRPGIAWELARNRKKAKNWEEKAKELETLAEKNINDKLELAEKMAKNVAEAVQILDLWIWILRRHAFFANKVNHQNFQRIEKIEKSIANITETNANPRLILENLFLEWEEK